VKKFKKVLIKSIKEKYDLKYSNKTEKGKMLVSHLNDSIREEDYKEYIDILIKPEIDKQLKDEFDYLLIEPEIHKVERFNKFNVKIEKLHSDEFCYDEKNNFVYKANIYRLSINLY